MPGRALAAVLLTLAACGIASPAMLGADGKTTASPIPASLLKNQGIVRSSTQTCQAQKRGKKGAHPKPSVIGRHPGQLPVVACEQPPRSEPNTGLTQATIAAVSTLG